MRLIRCLAILMLFPLAALAKPAAPQLSAQIVAVEVGLFCALPPMDSIPAPGTIAGLIHVPDGPLAFDWPGQRSVPATLGLAFGVKPRTQAGVGIITTETRVYRPGRAAPETWTSDIGDTGDSASFFIFETEDELIPGIWAFEAWDGPTRLYRVEFEVVPADDAIGIAQACGAIS